MFYFSINNGLLFLHSENKEDLQELEEIVDDFLLHLVEKVDRNVFKINSEDEATIIDILYYIGIKRWNLK